MTVPRARSLRRAFQLYTNYYIRGRNPTLVYSVERSGSIALFQSLSEHGEFVISTHYLDPAKTRRKLLSGSARWASRHVLPRGGSVNIISLVRSPVENMLSTFARDLPGLSVKDDSAGTSGHAVDPSDYFRRQYLESGRYLHLLTWFDTEFQVALGIDVYRHPFDKEAGFVRFAEGRFDVLIVQTEMDDEAKSRLVSEFLGLSDFRMLPVELSTSGAPDRAPGTPGDQSAYAEAYKALKRDARIPEKFLKAIVESRYARHFFRDDDMSAMRKRFTAAS